MNKYNNIKTVVDGIKFDSKEKHIITCIIRDCKKPKL